VYSGQQTGVIDGKPAAVDIADALMDSGDEEVNQAEENESSEDDDEEEVDEINHAKLSSAVIHAHSPGRRAHTSAVWTHLRRIHKHDVPGHEMNVDCTHVCVFPLTDGEEGVKRFCNQSLKLFRVSKAEKERIRQNQTHETQVEQTAGGSRKKCRRQEAPQTMT
jgi:hypothetical protein